MIRIAILDDEMEYIEQVHQITQKAMEQLGIEYELREYMCAGDLIFDLNENDYFDIYLLDVELPDRNGLEVAKLIRCKFWHPIIIYITNHVDYAIQAFEVNAFRYIPKMCLGEYLPKTYQLLSTDKWQEHQKIYTVITNSRIERIPYREIFYLKKDGKYVHIFHQKGICRVRKPLQEVVKELNSKQFLMIERGFVVNIHHVMSLKGQQILIRDGNYLPVGKPRLQIVRQAIIEQGEERWC